MKELLQQIQEKYPDTKKCHKQLWLAYYCIHGDLKQNFGSYDIFKAWLLREDVLTPAQLLIELKRDDSSADTKKYIEELRTKFVKEKEYWWNKED